MIQQISLLLRLSASRFPPFRFLFLCFQESFNMYICHLLLLLPASSFCFPLLTNKRQLTLPKKKAVVEWMRVSGGCFRIYWIFFTDFFSLIFVFCRTQDIFLFDEIEAEGSELKLSVFDHNGLSKDELIGEVVLR
jgi:hypothetical protein